MKYRKIMGLGILIIFFICCGMKNTNNSKSTNASQNISTGIDSSEKKKLMIFLPKLSKDSIEIISEMTNLNNVEISNNISQFLRQNETKIIKLIKPKVFNYYKDSYLDYKSGVTYGEQMNEKKLSKEDLEQILPTPTTAENLYKNYRLLAIYISNEKELYLGTIGLEFDCDWDIENALGIKINRWGNIKVGTAETSYFE